MKQAEEYYRNEKHVVIIQNNPHNYQRMYILHDVPQEGDMSALTACGNVCSHQQSVGTMEAIQPTHINIPGTTEVLHVDVFLSLRNSIPIFSVSKKNKTFCANKIITNVHLSRGQFPFVYANYSKPCYWRPKF